jgi:hypothetical protein
MTPNPQSLTPEPVPPPVPAPHRSGWFQRVAAVLFIVFCLELGLFLLIYPWTDSWSGNYFSWIGPIRLQASWHQFWNNSYLRGAVSGLGLVNIWVAVAEALRMYIGNDDRN